MAVSLTQRPRAAAVPMVEHLTLIVGLLFCATTWVFFATGRGAAELAAQRRPISRDLSGADAPGGHARVAARTRHDRVRAGGDAAIVGRQRPSRPSAAGHGPPHVRAVDPGPARHGSDRASHAGRGRSGRGSVHRRAGASRAMGMAAAPADRRSRNDAGAGTPRAAAGGGRDLGERDDRAPPHPAAAGRNGDAVRGLRPLHHQSRPALHWQRPRRRRRRPGYRACRHSRRGVGLDRPRPLGRPLRSPATADHQRSRLHRWPPRRPASPPACSTSRCFNWWRRSS